MQKIKRKDGFRYREKVYFDGKALYSPYFRGKTEAKTWKRNTLRERDKLRAIGITKLDSRTFKEYSEAWLVKKSDLERKSLEGYSSVLKKYLIPTFGRTKIKSLRLSDGDNLKTELLQNTNLSRVRINYILKVLKMVTNDAVKTGTLLRNPFLSLDNLKVQIQSRVYWLPREINQFLLANQDDYYYPLYCFLLNTGVRPCEARALMWDKVDFERSVIEISRSQDRHGLKDRTKSKKARFLKMNQITKDLLKNLRTKNKALDYVFIQPNGGFINMHFGDREFPKAILRAKVRKIQLRHLRSTFASNYVMNGGDIFALSKVLGHYSVQITEQRYADLHPSYMEKQAEVVSFGATKSAHIGLVSENDL